MSAKQSSIGLESMFATEQAIAGHLREHPDFFERHVYLLHNLHVPHTVGNAVSLIERQIGLLRKENQELKGKLGEMVEVARENDELRDRVQALTLRLMGAADLDEVLTTLQTAMKENFSGDFVNLRIISAQEGAAADIPASVSANDPGLAAFEHFFEARQPLCGRLRGDQLAYLFGQEGSEVGSAVLIPFRNASVYGMIAVGSRDARRFQPDMGTLFLGYLGELVGRAIRPEFVPFVALRSRQPNR